MSQLSGKGFRVVGSRVEFWFSIPDSEPVRAVMPYDVKSRPADLEKTAEALAAHGIPNLFPAGGAVPLSAEEIQGRGTG